MQAQSLGIAITFTAGLLSFLSPCVLPLIPSYVSFITGLSLDDVQRQRRAALVHSLLFVGGFTFVFLVLGATATVLGQLFHANREWVGRVGGVLVIALGVYLLGIVNIGFLSRDRRVHIANKPLGYLGTVVVGMAFAAGWTPCIGPILGGVLAYTASSADLKHGLVLLFSYSVGLALPFIAAALMVERFIELFQRFRGVVAWVSKASGAVLVAVGVLMVTGRMTMMSAWLQRWTPEFLWSRL